MSEANVVNAGSQVFVVGRDNFMFLTGGSHDVLSYLTGEREISEKSLRNFGANLAERSRRCRKANVAYCHLVCPDKQAVLRDQFPYEIKHCLGDVFREVTAADFLYPVQELRAVLDGGAYWRTDTHWTVEGRIVAVRGVLNAFGLQPAAIEPVFARIRAACTVNPDFSGDLGSKMSPRVTESGLVYKPHDGIKQFTNGLVGNNGTIKIYYNAAAPSRRLLVFGDSFIMSCLDILSELFRHILLIRSPFFHMEAFDMFAPTHVLSANAERYLSGVPADAGAPISFLMADLSGKPTSPSPGYFEALNASLRPRSAIERVFFEKLDAQT
jgi:hypothetical protein